MRLLGFLLVLAILVTRPPLAAAESRDRDPIRLRVGTLAIDGSRYMKDILALSEEIERRTHGSVQLDWVSDGQLGEEAKMADLLKRGKLDGAGFSETGLQALVPEMAAWGAPGLFHAYEDVDAATAALDPTVRERFANQGTVFVMWADLGFTRVFSTERITDLREVLRTSAASLAMAFDGTLTKAIADGKVRTWTLPPLYMLAIGPKARAMTNLRYRYVIGGLVFTRAAWSRLTPADQATVLEICHAWEPRIRKSWRKETERGIAALEKSGVQTHAASDVEIAAFVETSANQRAAGDATLAKLRDKIVAAIKRPRTSSSSPRE